MARKNRNVEYVPQFDYENCSYDEIAVTKKICKKCGKETMSLYQGLCLECYNPQLYAETKKSTASGLLEPDEELYNSWCEKRKRRKMWPFLYGLAWRPLLKFGFPAILLVWAITFSVSTLELALEGELFASLLMSFLSANLVFFGIMFIKIGKNRQHKRFLKLNDTVVKVGYDLSWKCPCCKITNIGARHCPECGVLPNFETRE